MGHGKHRLPIGCEQETQIGYDHDMMFQRGKSLSAVVPSGKLMLSETNIKYNFGVAFVFLHSFFGSVTFKFLICMH